MATSVALLTPLLLLLGCGHPSPAAHPAAEADASRVLQQEAFGITLDLNSGDASASVLTCDFSVDYVKINADYRT